jgi:hypothetical protein
MVLLAYRTLLFSSGTWKFYFFNNFERYNLANNKEWMCKIWWRCRYGRQLEDLMVINTKRVSNFGHFTLLSIEVEAVLKKNILKTLGIKTSHGSNIA